MEELAIQSHEIFQYTEGSQTMTIKEALAARTIVDVTEYSRSIWPELQVYYSEEMFHFMGLAQEYAASINQVIQDLLADIDYRIDIESLEHDVDHLLEVMVGEIPDWVVSIRMIGANNVLVANPRDEISQIELSE